MANIRKSERLYTKPCAACGGLRFIKIQRVKPGKCRSCYNKANYATQKARHRQGLCWFCTEAAAPGHSWCFKHLLQNAANARHRRLFDSDKRSKKAAEVRVKLRKEVLGKYGGSCRCCGEVRQEFLQIDHVNNDGAAHRRQIGPDVYTWLKRSAWPTGFQVLCANCNWAKRGGAVCPHQQVCCG